MTCELSCGCPVAFSRLQRDTRQACPHRCAHEHPVSTQTRAGPTGNLEDGPCRARRRRSLEACCPAHPSKDRTWGSGPPPLARGGETRHPHARPAPGLCHPTWSAQGHRHTPGPGGPAAPAPSALLCPLRPLSPPKQASSEQQSLFLLSKHWCPPQEQLWLLSAPPRVGRRPGGHRPPLPACGLRQALPLPPGHALEAEASHVPSSRL